ncbi:Uncharacterised protein [Mycobacteroides abscessus subsp. abscessus]|nr:Uncharacterised protein [Mycobacteroides abscessus subsp. abscessus]
MCGYAERARHTLDDLKRLTPNGSDDVTLTGAELGQRAS